jgi:hypothetical protein
LYGTMARKRHKPEEIVAELREADVLTGQDQLSRSQTHSGRNGWWAQPIAATPAAQYAQSPIGVITAGSRFTCYWAE